MTHITHLTFVDYFTNEKIELLNDFMGYVRYPERNNRCEFRHKVLPDIQSINWNMGYVVKKDGTIVCALEASMYIAQYEGCKENEINIYN